MHIAAVSNKDEWHIHTLNFKARLEYENEFFKCLNALPSKYCTYEYNN